MFIVAIGWMYVVLMISIAESSVTAGVVTFFLCGVFPIALILYLLGTPERKRRRAAKEILQKEAMQAEATRSQSTDNQKETMSTRLIDKLP